MLMVSSKSSARVLGAPTLAAIVLAIMVALYGADQFLAAQEQRELHNEAEAHYLAGRKAGSSAAAIVDLARAHTLERKNREYSLALADAQLAAHDLAGAFETTTELLDENSNEGRANLTMARILAEQNRLDDADAYYHRAIYGVWPASAQSEPYNVRLELAKLLAAKGRNRELLSELLLLQNGPAPRKVIAALFLQAGSAPRAADAYREVIHDDPADIDAYLGLAQAEVLSGNYRAAESAMMTALRRDPYNEGIQSQLRRVVKLASLDPTLRHLSAAERLRRSTEILKLVTAEIIACGQPAPPAPAANTDAEALLDQAEALWKENASHCTQPRLPDDPLPLLLKKLS